MSKKFTSFLVLAALLLAVPTHAQFAKKQSKAQVSAFKTNILKPADLAKAKDAKMKADAKFEGQAFRGFAAKGNYLQASLDKIQEDKAILQKQMEETQAELEVKEYEASAGGGVVNVKINGLKEITEIKIAEEVVDPDDIEMLQDLIMAAVNEAIRAQADDEKEQLSKITGGMGGGFGGLF